MTNEALVERWAGITGGMSCTHSYKDGSVSYCEPCFWSALQTLFASAPSAPQPTEMPSDFDALAEHHRATEAENASMRAQLAKVAGLRRAMDDPALSNRSRAYMALDVLGSLSPSASQEELTQANSTGLAEEIAIVLRQIEMTQHREENSFRHGIERPTREEWHERATWLAAVLKKVNTQRQDVEAMMARVAADVLGEGLIEHRAIAGDALKRFCALALEALSSSAPVERPSCANCEAVAQQLLGTEFAGMAIDSRANLGQAVEWLRANRDMWRARACPAETQECEGCAKAWPVILPTLERLGATVWHERPDGEPEPLECIARSPLERRSALLTELRSSKLGGPSRERVIQIAEALAAMSAQPSPETPSCPTCGAIDAERVPPLVAASPDTCDDLCMLPAPDAITAAVDAQLDPLKRELVDVGRKLAKEPK
jgi:hypothetical protein